MKTFKKVLKELRPAVFFVQETKYKDTGKIKIENYDIFELVRKSREGGGLALGCLKELQPAWVREGDDDVEALSVEIIFKNMKIRCCVAYGCQENDTLDRKDAFWTYLDEEVDLAEQNETGFVLQFDGNLWAGSQMIPGDPRPQNKNGKIFQEFLEQHPNLTVVNSLALCEGLLTRTRTREDRVEKSVLDFFVVCNRVLPFLTKMVIDEDKKYILTNYQAVRNGGKASDSDHNTQYIDLDLKLETVKPERIEMFNFKDKEGQIKFKQLTSETSEFSQCFQNNSLLSEQIENWRTVLKSSCRQSFSKIRIKKNKLISVNPKFSKLIDERNALLKDCDNPDDKRKLDKLNIEIASIEAEENRGKLMENFKYFSDNPEKIDMSKMWKLMKKLWPKHGNNLPTAKRNHKGKLVTGAREIKSLLGKEYRERLRSRPLRPDLLAMGRNKRKIFQLKMKLAERRESPDWTMNDLDKALGKLKNNKSRDFEGYINEIFKKNVIGSDLKKSLLIMFNKLRRNKLIVEFMNWANVTTVPKRGSRVELKNERGIFRVSVIRSILMGLIYNSKYSAIDSKMSNCQMGGRKGKGCKNNIFILNGIIHDVLTSKKMKPVLFQFYDYSQMFDSINLEEAICDIYDTGVQDENLALIYQANKEIKMAVKTVHGLSERQTIENIVLQGDTFGSILASVQVDKIGQDCMDAGHFYLYKNALPVGFLGLVDDIVGITEAGSKAQQLNAFINIKTAEKTLQFGVKKCKSMLISKKSENVINNDLQVDNWNVDYVDNKTTGVAELTEHYDGKIRIEKAEEYTYLGFVISCKGENMANIRQLKNKSIGVIRQIFNKLQSLNLKQYYFECAIILMNVMLRGTILYACDMYYNLKENELRQIERIEEGFLRKILKTTKGCPITQMYFEVGQHPARFEIQKTRLLYLKYILEQNEESNLQQMLSLQLVNPTKGDWASKCIEDLKELNINLTFAEIKSITKIKFTNILKKEMKKNAFKYLSKKRGQKGSEIEYSCLEMSEYLQPTNTELTVEQKCEVFAVRNRMINIEYNFPKKDKLTYCECGIKEDMQHIYNCELLSETKKNESLPYKSIFNGELEQQTMVYRIFKQNLEKREQLKSEPHVIHQRSAVISNG